MNNQDRHYIFTITTGRSGTSFLAELLARNLNSAKVYHEQLRYSDWGVNSPELSHLTTFNQIGNSSHMRAFWQQKLARIKALDVRYFAEMSHTLAKAGLVENLDLLQDVGKVHLIYLKRDIADTVISFINRYDFLAKGNMWLWYLDMEYPNNITSPKPFLVYGQVGRAIWYVIEMRARAEYYRLLLADQANVVFHEVEMEKVVRLEGATKLLADLGVFPATIRMPGRINESLASVISEQEQQKIRELIGSIKFDAADLARTWYDNGNRLASSGREKNLDQQERRAM